MAELVLNTTYIGFIRNTPYFLVYGQDPSLPYAVIMDPRTLPLYSVEQYRVMFCNLTQRMLQTTQTLLLMANEKYQTKYDRQFRTQTSKMQIGGRIYLKRLQPRKHKLGSAYLGPHRVKEIKNDITVIQHIKAGVQGEYHLSHMHPVKDVLMWHLNKPVPPFLGLPGYLGEKVKMMYKYVWGSLIVHPMCIQTKVSNIGVMCCCEKITSQTCLCAHIPRSFISFFCG